MKIISLITLAFIGSAAALPTLTCPNSVMSLPELAEIASKYTIDDAMRMIEHPETKDGIVQLLEQKPTLVSDVFAYLCYDEFNCYAEFSAIEAYKVDDESDVPNANGLVKRGQVQGLNAGDLRWRMEQHRVTYVSFGWGYQIYFPPHVIDRMNENSNRDVNELIDIHDSGFHHGVAARYLRNSMYRINEFNRHGKGVIVGALWAAPQAYKIDPASNYY